MLACVPCYYVGMAKEKRIHLRANNRQRRVVEALANDAGTDMTTALFDAATFAYLFVDMFLLWRDQNKEKKADAS